MIVVRLEMWPHGNPHRAYELGRTYIWNTGESTDPKRGHYGVAVARKDSAIAPSALVVNGPRASRRGEVRDYPRLSYNVWRLIVRALKSAFPEEAK